MTHAFARAMGHQLATKSDIDLLRREVESKIEIGYWKVIGAVALLLLANFGGVWGIVATYAAKSGP